MIMSRLMLLSVAAVSMLSGVSAMQTACEHQTLNLACAAGETLNIRSANYGRSDGSTCPHSSILTTSCSAASSLTKVQEACQDQESCSIQASNGVFGDPCVGTFKYLTVDYDCNPAPPTPDNVVCEHETLNLACGEGQYIDIVSASYGRSDSNTCPDPRILTTDCHATTSMDKVREACQGKDECSIDASNSVFGDPCVGTFKYLSVEYQCREHICYAGEDGAAAAIEGNMRVLTAPPTKSHFKNEMRTGPGLYVMAVQEAPEMPLVLLFVLARP